MRLHRGAFMLAVAVAATWYLRARRLRAPAQPPAVLSDGAGAPPAEPPAMQGDALDRLAAEVEARSDASDVVSVVEDLLSAPAERQRDAG